MSRQRTFWGLLCLIIAGLSPASAAELHLFDKAGCQGAVRMLHTSEPDFRAMDFDNRVASLMVITGVWEVFRDRSYEAINGPSARIRPGPNGPTCLDIAAATGGGFPANRMSAARLLAETPGPRPKGVAILYDFRDFGGSFRVLTRNVSDFRKIEFDNDAESIRVLSGIWQVYRNAGFGVTAERPSLILAPGLYPDISAVETYAPGTFPPDLMSSARVMPPGTPVPGPYEPLICAAGLVAGTTQCHSCPAYFDNSPEASFPHHAAPACLCAPGYVVNGPSVLFDGVTFVNCQPEAPLLCDLGQIAGDSRCHYCWDGYQNLPGSAWPVGPGRQCHCAAGHLNAGAAAGRLIDGVRFRDCKPE